MTSEFEHYKEEEQKRLVDEVLRLEQSEEITLSMKGICFFSVIKLVQAGMTHPEVPIIGISSGESFCLEAIKQLGDDYPEIKKSFEKGLNDVQRR